MRRIVVGGGKQSLPDDVRVDLQLVDEHSNPLASVLRMRAF
jgi:hypothetical protein